MGKSEAKQTKNYGSACSRNSGSMYWITYIVGKSQKDHVKKVRNCDIFPIQNQKERKPNCDIFPIQNQKERKPWSKKLGRQQQSMHICTYLFNIKMNNKLIGHSARWWLVRG